MQRLTRNPNIAVLRGDKDSTVVVIPKDAYIGKLEAVIEQRINEGKHEVATDKRLADLKSFQDFLYRNFHKILHQP